ncbi:VOC family protein [Janibacter alittae]|uniref:VOC family protein n=1 Tax=Janibacter alittae TaxID=3115209 RepID=A0ABZ2ME32_9MICO
MATRLNPYLNFDSTCREAMEFYQSVLGGELVVHTFGESMPGAGDIANQVMHASLETDAGYTIFASDSPPGAPRHEGAGMSISLSGDEPERLRRYWAGLSEGAEVVMPLQKQMWGDEFGMLTDRFGTPWMVNVAGDATQA